MATSDPDIPGDRPDPRFGPYRADRQRAVQAAPQRYTATDSGIGVTADSVRAWQSQRELFSTFVRADLCDPTGQVGPRYTAGSDMVLPHGVHPTLVLTDDAGRTLALNGTPCGYDGQGPRGAVRILVAEGLLPTDQAGPAVTTARSLTVHRPAGTPSASQPAGVGGPDPAVRAPQQPAPDRWQHTLAAVDPRLPADPHYPALVAALDRIDAAGVDVPAALTAATAHGALPDRHTGRALHLRLTSTCQAAITPPPAPAAAGPGQPAPTGPDTTRPAAGRPGPRR